MASRERYNDIECQNNGENLLNQTQEDVQLLDDMAPSLSQVDADFFDLSGPEKRYNFQNEICNSQSSENYCESSGSHNVLESSHLSCQRVAGSR